MSSAALFANVLQVLQGRNWGRKVKGPDGQLHDTGVQELVDALVQAMATASPIVLNEPLVFDNKTNDVPIQINSNSNPTALKVTQADGQTAQLGIGLTSVGILANWMVPVPQFKPDEEAVNARWNSPSAQYLGAPFVYGDGTGTGYTGTVGAGQGKPDDVTQSFQQLPPSAWVSDGIQGFTGNLTVVSAVSCTGGSLSVTTQTWTFKNGLLVGVA